MASHPGHSDLRNRQNILQDLQQQKQQLLTQGSGSSTPVTSTSSQQYQNRLKVDLNSHSMPMTRRTALEYASAYSSGYFISQDSQYGNLILHSFCNPSGFVGSWWI